MIIGITAFSLAVALLVAWLLLLHSNGDQTGDDATDATDEAVEVQDLLDAEASAAGNDGDLDAGDPAPTTPFEYFDGSSGSVTDYRGQPLVVNFFSTTCAACVVEMPDFQAVYQDVGDDVAFLGVNVGDTVPNGLKLIEETGVSFDTARNPDSSLLVEFGGIAMPHTVFITADGTVAKVNSGLLTEEALREVIDEELL